MLANKLNYGDTIGIVANSLELTIDKENYW